jgi:hypothetical protein
MASNLSEYHSWTDETEGSRIFFYVHIGFVIADLALSTAGLLAEFL